MPGVALGAEIGADPAAGRVASVARNSRSASKKSPGQVTLKFSNSPRTSSGEWPSASTALASSVMLNPPWLAARNAGSSKPRRNICGVCAAHLPSRLCVAPARAGAPPACSALRVSATGKASKPPTSSSAQAASSRATHSGRNKQRAASCTSTQSCARAPRARNSARPWATVSARLLPPVRAIQPRSPAKPGTAFSNPVSSGASTTSVAASCGTWASAARVCATSGRPATGMYCLGPSLPARLPLPAHGTRAKKRGSAPNTVMVIASILELHYSTPPS